MAAAMPVFSAMPAPTMETLATSVEMFMEEKRRFS